MEEKNKISQADRTSYREEIDKIDAEIVALFARRMEICGDIGRYKNANHLPILDAAREEQKLKSVTEASPEAIREYTPLLYSCLFELSKNYQKKIIASENALRQPSLRFLILNGPNLNLLGSREPNIYGKQTYSALLDLIHTTCQAENITEECFQSNHEGALVDKIQQAYGQFDGIIINPAAYTHTSVAILDALKAVALPAVEVHISDISQREDFRRISYAGMACKHTISGQGLEGYVAAILWLKQYLQNHI